MCFRVRSERLAKYNQLLRIEEELSADGTPPTYAGENWRHIGWCLRQTLCGHGGFALELADNMAPPLLAYVA